MNRAEIDYAIDNNKTIIEMKNGFVDLKTKVNQLEITVDKLEIKVDHLRDDIHQTNILLEDMNKKIDVYFDSISPVLFELKPLVQKNTDRIDHVEDRVSVLESVTKAHSAKISPN